MRITAQEHFSKFKMDAIINVHSVILLAAVGRSASPEEVINEFKQLLKTGYKEIILTGINVGDFGKSLSPDLDHEQNDQEHDHEYNLYSLLKMMLKVEGDYRIRISSIGESSYR